MMTTTAREVLLRQFDTAWMLADHHLQGLSNDECLWRPAASGLHVHRDGDGRWIADWPEHEGYDLGPSSIAWLTWHFVFWLSMAIDHCFGDATLARERIVWPGSADDATSAIRRLAAEWRAQVERLSDDDVESAEHTRWPFQDRPFVEILAWANVELTKSAAEIGYVRFLYAARERVAS